MSTATENSRCSRSFAAQASQKPTQINPSPATTHLGWSAYVVVTHSAGQQGAARGARGANKLAQTSAGPLVYYERHHRRSVGREKQVYHVPDQGTATEPCSLIFSPPLGDASCAFGVSWEVPARLCQRRAGAPYWAA
jgi:hypothetical protein